MTINVWLSQEWYDYKLKWDPDEYNGIRDFYMPSELIWVPDVALYNSAEGNYVVSIMTRAKVHFDGLVVWNPPAIFRSSCQINVTHYPFDTQKCHLKFGSWTHGNKIDLRHVNDTSGIIEHGVDLSEYHQNVEWDLMGAIAKRQENRYTCCPNDVYSDLTFNFTLRRKPLFYTVNLVLPCIGITFFSFLVFYLPSDSGEKVTLTISILVSLIFFLSVLIETIPPTSIAMPVLGKYIVFTMVLITMSVCATVCVLNIHFRTPSTHTMSPWVKRWFIDILPRYLFMSTPQYQQQGANAASILPEQLIYLHNAAYATQAVQLPRSSSIVVAKPAAEQQQHQKQKQNQKPPPPLPPPLVSNQLEPSGRVARQTARAKTGAERGPGQLPPPPPPPMQLDGGKLLVSAASMGHANQSQEQPTSTTTNEQLSAAGGGLFLPYLQSETARRLQLQRSRSSERDKTTTATTTTTTTGANDNQHQQQQQPPNGATNNCDKTTPTATLRDVEDVGGRPRVVGGGGNGGNGARLHHHVNTNGKQRQQQQLLQQRLQAPQKPLLWRLFKSSKSADTQSSSDQPATTPAALELGTSTTTTCKSRDDNNNNNNNNNNNSDSNRQRLSSWTSSVSSALFQDADDEYQYHRHFQARASLCSNNLWRIGPTLGCKNLAAVPANYPTYYRPSLGAILAPPGPRSARLDTLDSISGHLHGVGTNDDGQFAVRNHHHRHQNQNHQVASQQRQSAIGKLIASATNVNLDSLQSIELISGQQRQQQQQQRRSISATRYENDDGNEGAAAEPMGPLTSGGFIHGNAAHQRAVGAIPPPTQISPNDRHDRDRRRRHHSSITSERVAGGACGDNYELDDVVGPPSPVLTIDHQLQKFNHPDDPDDVDDDDDDVDDSESLSPMPPPPPPLPPQDFAASSGASSDRHHRQSMIIWQQRAAARSHVLGAGGGGGHHLLGHHHHHHLASLNSSSTGSTAGQSSLINNQQYATRVPALSSQQQQQLMQTPSALAQPHPFVTTNSSSVFNDTNQLQHSLGQQMSSKLVQRSGHNFGQPTPESSLINRQQYERVLAGVAAPYQSTITRSKSMDHRLQQFGASNDDFQPVSEHNNNNNNNFAYNTSNLPSSLRRQHQQQFNQQQQQQQAQSIYRQAQPPTRKLVAVQQTIGRALGQVYMQQMHKQPAIYTLQTSASGAGVAAQFGGGRPPLPPPFGGGGSLSIDMMRRSKSQTFLDKKGRHLVGGLGGPGDDFKFNANGGSSCMHCSLGGCGGGGGGSFRHRPDNRRNQCQQVATVVQNNNANASSSSWRDCHLDQAQIISNPVVLNCASLASVANNLNHYQCDHSTTTPTTVMHSNNNNNNNNKRKPIEPTAAISNSSRCNHHNHNQQQQQLVPPMSQLDVMMLISEVEKTIQNAMFIAQHIDNMDEFGSVRENWKYIAMVIDRVFLIIFLFACVFGTVLIFSWVPWYSYLMETPIDIQLSRLMWLNRTSLAAAGAALDSPTCQDLMV